jgi:hypothetical protein
MRFGFRRARERDDAAGEGGNRFPGAGEFSTAHLRGFRPKRRRLRLRLQLQVAPFPMFSNAPLAVGVHPATEIVAPTSLIKGTAPSERGDPDVRLGRKPTLTPHQRREAIKRVHAEKETLGARSCNVSRWTISRL